MGTLLHPWLDIGALLLRCFADASMATADSQTAATAICFARGPAATGAGFCAAAVAFCRRCGAAAVELFTDLPFAGVAAAAAAILDLAAGAALTATTG